MAKPVALVRKREISRELVTAFQKMDTGEYGLEDMLAFIDGIAQNDPGDERQQAFYAATRQLARKVSEVRFASS